MFKTSNLKKCKKIVQSDFNEKSFSPEKFKNVNNDNFRLR